MTHGADFRSRSVARQSARARELTFHAVILALVIWSVVGADVLSSGPLGRYSHFPKGNDFVQFYVAGSLAKSGAFGALADPEAFRQAQLPYLTVHTSPYPAVYGPQVGLLFALFACLPYVISYAAWSVLTFLLIAWSVRTCWRHCPQLAKWPWPVVALTAAFPPVGYLVLDGQLSGMALAALGMLVVALAQQSRGLAGLAVGVLGYKFSLFVPAVSVCVLSGEWIISAVALGVAALQVLGVAPVVGLDVVTGFFHNTMSAVREPDLLAARPYLMGSLRTFWTALLPDTPARVAYAVSAVMASICAAWGWRRNTDALRRVALLSLAVALSAPHFYLYDLVIVIPAFIASAAIIVNQRAPVLHWCVYLAFLTPLAVPLAAITHVQPVTVVLSIWLISLARHVVHGVAQPLDARTKDSARLQSRWDAVELPGAN